MTQGPTRRDATSRLSGTAAAQRQSESSSEEESTESSSESESSDEEVLQAPLPSSRPSAPLQATHYDAVKALWRPSGHLLDNASIRDGISKFWDLVSTIRNRWKSDAEEVKKAKEANKTNDVPLLEERVDKQREMLQIALQAAIEFGHVEIIEKYVIIHVPVSGKTLLGIKVWERLQMLVTDLSLALAAMYNLWSYLPNF